MDENTVNLLIDNSVSKKDTHLFKHAHRMALAGTYTELSQMTVKAAT